MRQLSKRIRTLGRRRLLAQRCGTWWVALCLSAAVAGAQEPSSLEARDDAKVHFRRGVELYEEGDLEAALAEFARADELAPDFRLRYNMAQVQVERDDYAAALALFEQYLAAGGDRVPTERRALVDTVIERLRRRVVSLWVGVSAPRATLRVGEAAPLALPLASPVLVNPGRVQVRVEAEGFQPYVKTLTVASGETPRLELALEPLTRPETVLPAPVERRVDRVDATPVWIGAAAFAACGLGAITAGAFALRAEGKLEDRLNAFPGNVEDIDAARSQANTLAAVSDGLSLAAVAAAGVGVYYLINPRVLPASTNPGGDSASLELRWSGRGVSFSGSF